MRVIEMIREKTRNWMKANKKNLSWAEISRETGIDADYISKFVRGVRPNPECETMEVLWKYLKTKGFEFHYSENKAA